MFDPKEFQAGMSECTYEAGDKTVSFHVREPNAGDVLHLAKNARVIDGATTGDVQDQVFRDLFGRFIVHPDGKKLSQQEVDGMMKMGFRHTRHIADIIKEKISEYLVTPESEQDEEKND